MVATSVSESERSVSRREERRLQHHDLSRTQLLDAAEEVFGRKGFHDATLKEIVELAEFSVGSVYSFFSSKDDLFRQLFRRRGEQFLPRMTAVLEGRGTALELLHDLVDFEVGFFREHPHFGRLWLRYADATPQSVERLDDDEIVANYRESMRLHQELFARGQREGVFAAGKPEAFARLLSGLVAAFQSLDLSASLDDASPGDDAPDEHMTLDELQQLVERAFTP